MTTTPTTPGSTVKGSSASSNTVVLAVPGGLQDGDAIAFFGTHQNQPPSDWALPSGMSRIGNAFVVNDADYRGTIIAAKSIPTASGTPSPLTMTFSGIGRIAGFFAIIRGANLSSLDAGHPAAKATISGTQRIMPSFNVAEDNCLLLLAANNQVTSPNADTATIDDAAMTLLDAVASPGDTTVTRSSLKVWKRSVNAGATGTKTVTWTGAATGASIMAVAIRPAADVAPSVVAFSKWDGTAEHAVTVKIYDGAAEKPITAFAVKSRDLTVPAMLALPRPFYWAHRFGSGNWVEFSARAAKEAASFWLADALECSCQWSADGTIWLSHDAYLDRMVLGNANGTTLPIASLTDAQIRTYTQVASYTDNPTQPGEKLMTLNELDALYSAMPLVIEDKTYTHQAALRTWIDAHGGAARCIWKQAGPGNRSASAAGLTAWGYFFSPGDGSTDMDSFAAKQGQWDLVGISYKLTDAELAAAVATAGKARIVPHILPNVTQKARMLAAGARGLMVSNVRDVIPKPF